MIPWRCKNGHVLGLIMDYGHTNCLLLVDPRSDSDPLESFAAISGRADVRCLVCGEVRTWHFSLRQHLTTVL